MSNEGYFRHPEYKNVYGPWLLLGTTKLTQGMNNNATGIARAAWAYLKKPRVSDRKNPSTGEPFPPTYEVEFLIDKGPTADLFIQSLYEAAEKLIEFYNEGVKTKVLLNTEYLVQDGDIKAAKSDKYDFYKNKWVILATETRAPKIYSDKLDEKGDLVEADPDIIVGGVQIIGEVQPFFAGKGSVKLKLRSLRLRKDDGVRFGGGIISGKSLKEAMEEEATESAASQFTAASALTSAAEAEAPAAPKTTKKNLGLLK